MSVTKTYYPQWTENDGWADAGTSTGFDSAAVGIPVSVGLTEVVRFPYVEIPPGSTITSAVVSFGFWQKTATNAASVGMNIFFENVDSSPPFTNGVYEDARTRTAASFTGTFTWNTAQGSFQRYTSGNMASVLQSVINRSGWKAYGTVGVLIDVTSETGDINMEASGSSAGPPMLEVTYDPPNDNVTWVGNLIQNPSFEVDAGYWESFNVIGYQDTATVAVSTEQALFGTKSLKVTLPTDGELYYWGNHWGLHLELGKLYTFSAHVYIPAGMSIEVGLSSPGIFWADSTYTGIPGPLEQATTDGQRGQWVRIHRTFISTKSSGVFLGVSVTHNKVPYTGAQYFYIDGVMLTEGDVLYDYFDGDTVDDDYRSYRWTDLADKSTSVMIGTKSTITAITPTPTGYYSNLTGRTDTIQNAWTYSNPSGEPQDRIEWRLRWY